MPGPRRTALTLDRRLAAYTLAGGAVLAAADPARADILYSGLQNLLVGTNSSTNIDLNGDGTNDFTIVNRVNPDAPGAQELVIQPVNTTLDAVIGTNGGTPARDIANALNAGDPIASGGNYKTGTGTPPSLLMRDALGTGNWVADGADRYLGLRVEPVDTVNNFGWARVAVNPDLTAVVRDWAFNTVAGEQILAGQTVPVPEPSSLALLAVGSAAVATWKRRRSPAAAEPATSP